MSDTIEKLEAKAADTSLSPEERVAFYEKAARLRRDQRRALMKQRIEASTREWAEAPEKPKKEENELVPTLVGIVLFMIVGFLFFFMPVILVKLISRI